MRDVYKEALSDRVNAIQPSAIRKFFDLANEMEDVISLSIGEPDFVTPWGIRQAGVQSLVEGMTHYSPNQGLLSLRESISNYLLRRFGLSYDPKKEILVTVGGSEAIDLGLRALVNPEDEVIIPEPAFVAYKSCAILAGAKPVTIDLKADNGFKLTADQLEQVISDRSKVLVLAFPNNPTGTVLSTEELKPIADLCAKHRITVISDELYLELTYGVETTSFASLPAMRDQTLMVGGFSKAFAMTGWRIGYVAGPAEYIAALNKIHQYAIMCSPSTAQYAAIEAMERAEDYIQPMRREYNYRRNYILASLDEMGIACAKPQGAFYVFPDISPAGLSSADFCSRFLQEEKVAIVPGTAFGDCGEGYVRISYAASLEDIKEALVRLDRFYHKLL